MTELTRDWERQVRVGARAIWGRGYNEPLTAIIEAARCREAGEEIGLYAQGDPNSGWAYDQNDGNLTRAYPEDIWCILDNALTFGITIEFCDQGARCYIYEPGAAAEAAPLFAGLAA